MPNVKSSGSSRLFTISWSCFCKRLRFVQSFFLSDRASLHSRVPKSLLLVLKFVFLLTHSLSNSSRSFSILFNSFPLFFHSLLLCPTLCHSFSIFLNLFQSFPLFPTLPVFSSLSHSLSEFVLQKLSKHISNTVENFTKVTALILGGHTQYAISCTISFLTAIGAF